MAPVSGLLYVTMQPHSDLPSSHFHDWYNNEHGPIRLRLPFVTNGFRYRATDLGADAHGTKEMPEWLAIYDITDMDELNSDAYLRLRGPPHKSQREAGVMKKIDVDRKCFDELREWKKDGYKTLEDVDAEGIEGGVLVSVSSKLRPGVGVEELDRWYEEEHVPMLSKVPGWRRTRRFKSSAVVKPLGPKDEIDETEYVSLHEYAPENGLGGPEIKAATSTPWAKRVNEELVGEKKRRVYKLAYTFGPAPRYLSSLATREVPAFTSPSGDTKTLPASDESTGAIESFVTTKDGVNLAYRLEGSPDPQAPLIVLSNSILVDWHIWDDFVQSFLADARNNKYRILRYQTRGRTRACGSQPVTVDLLASDIITLLDALRVPKAAAAMGVSMGGVTVMDVALKYPNRVSAFVACDTNAAAPAANSKLWSERIEVAEQEGAKAKRYGGNLDTTATDDDAVVGEKLAEMTVRRWFVPESYDGGAAEEKVKEVKAAVERNSLEGFKASARALYQYDFWAEMGESSVPGAFLAGAGDGKLPAGMKEMRERFGDGKGDYFVVEGAGHLPMVEKPEEVARLVTGFLSRVGGE